MRAWPLACAAEDAACGAAAWVGPVAAGFGAPKPGGTQKVVADQRSNGKAEPQAKGESAVHQKWSALVLQVKGQGCKATSLWPGRTATGS